jgi:hypothetical protein
MEKKMELTNFSLMATDYKDSEGISEGMGFSGFLHADGLVGGCHSFGHFDTIQELFSQMKQFLKDNNFAESLCRAQLEHIGSLLNVQ